MPNLNGSFYQQRTFDKSGPTAELRDGADVILLVITSKKSPPL